MMAIDHVPVIYDVASKKVLRWYLLDYAYQADDPAFNPVGSAEEIVRVPMETYKTFGKSIEGFHALTDIQNYVNGNS